MASIVTYGADQIKKKKKGTYTVYNDSIKE